MYYYILSRGVWHEVNRDYYRDFIADLRRDLAYNDDRDLIIAQRSRKSNHPLTIFDLRQEVDA